MSPHTRHEPAAPTGAEATTLYVATEISRKSWLVEIMVGTPTAGDDEGDQLVETAALNHDVAARGLDAAFGGIWWRALLGVRRCTGIA